MEVWGYTFFIFHLSSGIAVFYLLKFLQEKVFPNWGKRTRTVTASLFLLVVFGWPGYYYDAQQNYGMPQAHLSVALIKERLAPGDKLYVQHPWDDPVRFLMLSEGVDQQFITGPPAPALAVSEQESEKGVILSDGVEEWNDFVKKGDEEFNTNIKALHALLNEDPQSDTRVAAK